MPYKVLQDFEIPGFPLFEAGMDYDIIPNAEEMENRGLIVSTEKMVDKTPAHVKTDESKSHKKTTKL